MSVAEIVLGIILLVTAVFLIVAVLMQSGKAHNLSGTIAGGAETFFGKTKGKTIDKMLSKITTIVSVCFVILVIVIYVIQPNTAVDPDKVFDENADLAAGEVTTADTAEETEAEVTTAADING